MSKILAYKISRDNKRIKAIRDNDLLYGCGYALAAMLTCVGIFLFAWFVLK